ncbi:MAG: MFS transporter [Veillonellaceae bacterium]|nr:MFS transporter [Veillonellaceae bacterium]
MITNMFPAFRETQFRRFWLSQFVALNGLWMQLTAQQWLVYSLTGSPLLLGLLGVAQFGPLLLFSLPAGVFVDRWPKRTILRATQTAYMLQAATLALLVFTGWVNYYNVLALAFLYGCIQTVDSPARQAYIPDLVQPIHLRSAIGLNSANFNAARMIGPALAAVLMAKFGAGWLFLLNALSMLPVLWVYWQLPVPGLAVHTAARENVLREIHAGIYFVRHNFPVAAALIAMAIISMLIMNYNVISPVYADRVLHSGVTGFGLVNSAIGVGAFTAAILTAAGNTSEPAARSVFGSGLAAVLILALLSLIDHFYLALAAFAAFGFCNLQFIINVNTTVQMHSTSEYRGRVLSLYTLLFLGATPPGNLLTGSAIEHLGVRAGMLTCVMLALLCYLPLLVSVIRHLRRNPDAFTVPPHEA